MIISLNEKSQVMNFVVDFIFWGCCLEFFSHLKEKNLQMILGEFIWQNESGEEESIWFNKCACTASSRQSSDRKQEEYKGLPCLWRATRWLFQQRFSFLIIFNLINNKEAQNFLLKCNVENCNSIMQLHQGRWKNILLVGLRKSIIQCVYEADSTDPHLTSTFITVLDQVFKSMKNNFPIIFTSWSEQLTCSNNSPNSHFNNSSFKFSTCSH